VEDNVTNQQVVKRQLGMLGYSLDIANHGVEALELLKNGDYSIVLTDMHMPVMDGVQLTKEIRALESNTNQHIPIIAITANAMKGEDEKYLSLGVDDYLSKPIELVQLKEKLIYWSDHVNTRPSQQAQTSPNNQDRHNSTTNVLAPLADDMIQNLNNTDLEQDQAEDQKVPEAKRATSIDLSALSTFAGDDPDMQLEILKEFVSPSLDSLKEMNLAVQNNDLLQASEMGHKLKSAARLIG
jgi:two-component system sensor histidine kinase/response regulator